jgi:hypothetical protein
MRADVCIRFCATTKYVPNVSAAKPPIIPKPRRNVPFEKARAARVRPSSQPARLADPKSEERRKMQIQALLARRREEDERRKREQEERRSKRMEHVAKQREQQLQHWNLENDPNNGSQD